jgi:hypothetical protein
VGLQGGLSDRVVQMDKIVLPTESFAPKILKKFCHPIKKFPVASTGITSLYHFHEREQLVTALPVMSKSRAPAGGNSYPESGLVKPPRRDTRALSPAGMFGAKAPLRADRTRHQCPCAVRLLTFFANGEYKLD